MAQVVPNNGTTYTTAGWCQRCSARVYYGTPVVWFTFTEQHGPHGPLSAVQINYTVLGCPRCPGALQAVLITALQDVRRELDDEDYRILEGRNMADLESARMLPLYKDAARVVAQTAPFSDSATAIRINQYLVQAKQALYNAKVEARQLVHEEVCSVLAARIEALYNEFDVLQEQLKRKWPV